MGFVSGIVSKKAMTRELEMKLPGYMKDKTVIKKRLTDLLQIMIQILDSKSIVIRNRQEKIKSKK